MTENEFNIVRSAGFVVATTVAVALQRWRPHAHIRRALGTNVGLWAVNLIVLGAAAEVAHLSAAGGAHLQSHAAVPLRAIGPHGATSAAGEHDQLQSR